MRETCLDYIHFFLGILHTCLKLVRCPTDTAFSMFVIENGTLHIVYSVLSNPVFGTANVADEQRSDKMVSEICSSTRRSSSRRTANVYACLCISTVQNRCM